MELGEMHDCYIAKNQENLNISLLGTPIVELCYD